VTLFIGRKSFQHDQQVVDVILLLVIVGCNILRSEHLLYQQQNDHSMQAL